MQLDTLLIFLFSASILTLSPGPDIIYVFLKSSTDGKIAGIKTVLGLTTGLFFHTILLVFGISALINSNEYFFMLITYNENSKINENKKTNRSDFVTGLMMNVLNPKVSIFFIAFFPNYIFHNSWSYELQFSILGILFWLIANIIFMMVVLLSSINTKLVNNLIKHKYVKNLKIIFYVFIAIWILV